MGLNGLEELFFPGFKILNGLPDSIVIEQQAPASEVSDWEERIEELVGICRNLNVKRVGFTFLKGTPEEVHIKEALMEKDFGHFSSKVEVYKDLRNMEALETSVPWRSLESPDLTEEDFKKYWDQSMGFSANSRSTLSMDQQLDSVRAELGEGWRDACRVFYEGETAIGVAMPHIEPDTKKEGRLFFFGILPPVRGRRLGSFLHKQALNMLKEIGADYYIGATHLANKGMQRVFEENGCTVRAYTESFYRYF